MLPQCDPHGCWPWPTGAERLRSKRLSDAATADGDPTTATAYVSQVQELERRVNELDISNRDMHTRLAQSEQQQQIYRDQTVLLQQQLRDTANQLRDTQLRDRKLRAVCRCCRRRRATGRCRHHGNNSVRQALSTIDIPGVDMRQDQDVIRIEMPADELFQAGTAQLSTSAYTYLDRVADAIARTTRDSVSRSKDIPTVVPRSWARRHDSPAVVHAGSGRL